MKNYFSVISCQATPFCRRMNSGDDGNEKHVNLPHKFD